MRMLMSALKALLLISDEPSYFKIEFSTSFLKSRYNYTVIITLVQLHNFGTL